MKIFKFFVLAFILLGTQHTLFSQEYFFRSYSIEQGLPQSTIFCALEDSRGEMWIGTEGSGICRFNGIDVQVMDRSDGLSGNIVRSVFEDSKGNIWIGTENSLNKYDGFTLQSFADTKISETPVLAINEDKKGNIWIGTESKGLFRIEYADSLVIENYTVSEGLANMFIFDIDVDNKDRVWLSLVGGVNIVEYEPDNFHVTKLIEGYDIPSSIILCGSMDPEGNMWFGTYQEGVFKVEPGDDLNNVTTTSPDHLGFFERRTYLGYSLDREQ
ncbi:two-component regulator propeller domain-containing protein [Bacteroidota bacterium]